ncbi:MAG: hypothetical protein J6H31_12025 [Butyrivibrio sp.]|nr:hypothetical protein [Butyrivibrio sp.]MCR5777405.1 hypothetical protein [Lachnospiraceae bacterium]
MGRRFVMNLDPMNDGIVGTIEKAESTAGKCLVVGTNYDHKVISESQFEEITGKLSQEERLGLLIIGDYMLYYDTSKLINIDGDNYFIGSFLMVQVSNDGQHAYSWLRADDIRAAKDEITDYFTEVVIDGERYDALYVG